MASGKSTAVGLSVAAVCAVVFTAGAAGIYQYTPEEASGRSQAL